VNNKEVGALEIYLLKGRARKCTIDVITNK
jgi:hypothetical protein